jgi:hypothetical protein
LSFKSKAALALALGRNPVIGHKRAHLKRLYFVETEVSESTARQCKAEIDVQS